METGPGQPPKKPADELSIEELAGREAIEQILLAANDAAKAALEQLTEEGQQSENPPEGSDEEKALNLAERLYRRYQEILPKLTPKGQG